MRTFIVGIVCGAGIVLAGGFFARWSLLALTRRYKLAQQNAEGAIDAIQRAKADANLFALARSEFSAWRRFQREDPYSARTSQALYGLAVALARGDEIEVGRLQSGG